MEAVERLDLLGLITMDAARRRDMPHSRTRKDIFAQMVRSCRFALVFRAHSPLRCPSQVNQRDLEEKFNALMEKRGMLRGLSNKKKYQANEVSVDAFACLRLRDCCGGFVSPMLTRALTDRLSCVS